MTERQDPRGLHSLGNIEHSVGIFCRAGFPFISKWRICGFQPNFNGGSPWWIYRSLCQTIKSVDSKVRESRFGLAQVETRIKRRSFLFCDNGAEMRNAREKCVIAARNGRHVCSLCLFFFLSLLSVCFTYPLCSQFSLLKSTHVPPLEVPPVVSKENYESSPADSRLAFGRTKYQRTISD